MTRPSSSPKNGTGRVAKGREGRGGREEEGGNGTGRMKQQQVTTRVHHGRRPQEDEEGSALRPKTMSWHGPGEGLTLQFVVESCSSLLSATGTDEAVVWLLLLLLLLLGSSGGPEKK